ncbi:pyrroloquinoline quinone biosynthesis protein PqqB [Tunturiibacter lichenicola]|uniref:pyrroloquinoline quinone biosynthesis protein PqqB n=1 Tax=Tunturiibacter lichenicola TaxID=2051959 RepID=UPI0021B34FBD|nr:pyrroloquinoline quinone biosynthesis protein PqqB [Edaphobacter lichenicola]
MRIKVLGAAAGGGLPQWNCACTNCSAVRNNEPNIRARSQSQLAVAAENDSWFLVNASPDLRDQLIGYPDLHPNSKNHLRDTPVAGVILTSADLDHVLGLLLMREFTPVRIYATRPVISILKKNSFFQMLDRLPGQSRWTTIEPGVSFHLGQNLICTPIALSGSLPAYVREEDRADLDLTGATIGVLLEEVNGARIAYLPALSSVSPSLKELLCTCSAILIDGTFWSDDELQRIQPGTPLSRSMGHLPISGQDGSLSTLRDLNGPRKIYTHINNTNPILNEQSSERQQVDDAGWEVAWDGQEITI